MLNRKHVFSSEKTENVSSLDVLFDKLKWMTSKEAAFYLRMPPKQLRYMAASGQIKCYKLAGRLRFLKSDLDLLFKPHF